MSDELDLEPFGRIVDRLGEAVAAITANPFNELFRDSVIKRFEPALELSRNTLCKFLLMAERVVAEVPAFPEETVRT